MAIFRFFSFFYPPKYSLKNIMRISLLLFICFYCITIVNAQKKKLQAFFIDSATVELDGVLEESFWEKASAGVDFIQNAPNPSKAERFRTTVYVAYNNDGIYVGAKLFDLTQDSVPSELTNRDQTGNASFFGISLSPYNDGQNGFEFFTTSAGVQVDTKIALDQQDYSWNGVWQNKVAWHTWGWSVEMYIPYTNLRFPKKEIQSWTCQFTRYNRKYRETEFWNEIKPEQNGFLNQGGILSGLQNLDPPVRLALFPYVSSYYEQFGNQQDVLFNGGLDVKWGVTDAFTLDATLIPDFGQVQSDDQVLNLSPFEVQFNENRQFFTEGTELFNKAGLFYSRRVGGAPLNVVDAYDDLAEGDSIISSPAANRLVNASKFSGRTKGGLGIGVFNAVTDKNFVRILNADGVERKVEVNPLSNYSVIVLDQNLKHNSYITLTNTNVLRSGRTYDANVTALNFNIKNKPNSFFVEGGLYNSILTKPKSSNGQQYQLNVGKLGGKFRYGVRNEIVSPTYNHNDLGFFTQYNFYNKQAYFTYVQYKPVGIFNSTNHNLTVSHTHRIEPFVYTDFAINLSSWFVLNSFDGLGYTLETSPYRGRDYFSPRTEGRYFKTFASNFANIFFSSDYRRRLALDVRASLTTYQESPWQEQTYTIAPRWRVNNRLMFIFSYQITQRKNELGYAVFNNAGTTAIENQEAAFYDAAEIYYGKRNVRVTENILTAKYAFSPRLSTNLRVRHQWLTLKNTNVFSLANDGTLEFTNFEGKSVDGTSYLNSNFNTLNLDFTLRWIFTPGSELSVNWKKIVLNYSDTPLRTYEDSFNALGNLSQLNSVSIKLLYYLDYNKAKKFLKL